MTDSIPRLTSVYENRRLARASQGDIYGEVQVLEQAVPDNRTTTYGYATVLTQDCDLEQDWDAHKKVSERGGGLTDADKYLRHLILAPCYVLEQFLGGTHIGGRAMKKWPRKEFENYVRDDKHVRYHCLPSHGEYGVPDLVVDFKHYFSIERDAFYSGTKQQASYICSLGLLHRQALAQRFASYLSRVGIPSPQETGVESEGSRF